MTFPTTEMVSARLAAERGALFAAAGALAVLAATAAARPDLLMRLVGPAPAPDLLALLSAAAALPAGAEVGRRAARLRADPVRRRRHLLAWTFAAYLGSLTVGAAALTLGEIGPAALADPFGFAVRGLTAGLLLLPWAALPVAATAFALERFVRPSAERRLGPGGGAGPPPGTRAPRPERRRPAA